MERVGNTELLVRDCRTGDERAWATLVRRFAPLVGAIARSYGLNAADCEDVSQATWVRLWRGLDGLRQPELLTEWLSMVARREALRHVGAKQPPAPTGDLVLLERGRHEVSAEEVVVSREFATRLRAAFRSLPAQCQHLLALLVEGRSYAEVSDAMGLAAGSVGPVRSRCLERLRQALGELDAAAGESRCRTPSGAPSQSRPGCVRHLDQVRSLGPRRAVS
ncbi:RNA polymerase sigma factor [Phytohabitans houttuyneae]|uniref:RNA polymerase sigma factor n=1 Tax=Phytohabitans houttuyneae TaxID=1076126 RepID=A0A6V8KHQ8_9ACTN|nr:sigma-70 family RNA polymerase sigma factor [Phytohabitans houttuyneae]GFJ83374.1 RNA polymerase sigma factor [Phytohabitans houttuyneae]